MCSTFLYVGCLFDALCNIVFVLKSALASKGAMQAISEIGVAKWILPSQVQELCIMCKLQWNWVPRKRGHWVPL